MRGSATLERLQAIRDEPFVSAAEAERRQLERLRELLHYCATTVPYYRQRFAEAGVCAADIRTWGDFAALPVLTKRDVRDHAEALVSEAVDRSKLLPHHSGGSTGVPLRFYRTLEYATESEAGTYRNLAQCGWTPGEMIGFFWGANEKLESMSAPEFVARQWLRRMYQFDPFRSGPDDMDGWSRAWRLVRPRVALGYASTIARFARHLEHRGIRPAPLRGVFTTAEKLYPPQRELISRVFGAPVFDCYGSSEVQNIAAECPNGRMHIMADYVVVETEPAAAPDGAPPPLILTSLKNRAMPLIRYRNEDCGRLVAERCDCGSGFPLMSLEVARTSDNFTLPNGRVVHGEFFTHLLYGSEGVDSFQFHQTAVDRIVLRYVASGAGDPSPALRHAATEVDRLAPGLIRVEVEAVTDIALSNAGKHRFTRSDVS
jgi:phenylacetate-CoA ligase